ncbi:unnamed protein product, partial [Laminaria digitata]
GEDLARCYQGAGVQLHASLTQPLHQRLAECAFAGGLTICRVPRDAFSLLNDQAIEESDQLGIGDPLPDDVHGRRIRIDDLPTSKRMVTELRRLGLCGPDEYRDGMLTWPGFKVHDARTFRTPAVRAHTAAFADMTSLFFACEGTLENLFERAINDAQWHREQSERTCE